MENSEVKIIDEKLIKTMFKIRGREGYKGLFGHTGIFAGTLRYVGAPYFTSEAAVRSGSGLVTLFVYDEISEIMKIKLNEEMVRSNPFIGNRISDREESEVLGKLTSIVFGPGLGDDLRTLETFMALKNLELPLVIDADGLNILNRVQRDENLNEISTQVYNKILEKDGDGGKNTPLELLKSRKSTTILTPHLGEFARLTGKNVEEIRADRENIAREFAKKYKVVLVLKDSQTLITDGEEIYINDKGNSSMSNGGMGDLLAGLIGSLLSQGYSAIEGGILGAYILGRCGDELSKERFIVNPRDILEEIPFVMKNIASNCNC